MAYREVTWAHSIELTTINVQGKPSVTAASMKSVLVALADRKNTKTGQCNPSQETLARDTALSVSTVNRALAGLMQLGVVERKRNPIGGGGREADSYIFNTELRTSQPANVAEEEDEPRISEVRTSQAAGVAPIYKPGSENRERTGNAIERKTNRESLFENAWKHWPRKVSKAQALAKFHRVKDPALVAAAIVAHGDAHAQHTPTEYVPHLVTWLNQSRWDDEQLPQPRATDRQTPGQRNLAYLANLAARENGPKEITA